MRAVWTLLLTAVVAMGAVRAHHKLRRFQHGATLSASTSRAHHHVRAHRVPVVVAAPAELPRIDASIAAVAVAPIASPPPAELVPPVARGPPSV
jgi:hypothetical protein